MTTRVCALIWINIPLKELQGIVKRIILVRKPGYNAPAPLFLEIITAI